MGVKDLLCELPGGSMEETLSGFSRLDILRIKSRPTTEESIAQFAVSANRPIHHRYKMSCLHAAYNNAEANNLINISSFNFEIQFNYKQQLVITTEIYPISNE